MNDEDTQYTLKCAIKEGFHPDAGRAVQQIVLSDARSGVAVEASDLGHGYSLKLIMVSKVHIEQVVSYGKTKTKVWFTYNGREYERISLTDPDYFCDGIWDYKSAIIFVSLAHQPFITDTGEERYYKFIAKVFPLL